MKQPVHPASAMSALLAGSTRTPQVCVRLETWVFILCTDKSASSVFAAQRACYRASTGSASSKYWWGFLGGPSSKTNAIDMPRLIQIADRGLELPGRLEFPKRLSVSQTFSFTAICIMLGQNAKTSHPALIYFAYPGSLTNCLPYWLPTCETSWYPHIPTGYLQIHLHLPHSPPIHLPLHQEPQSPFLTTKFRIATLKAWSAVAVSWWRWQD
jgi:hypothetical protein